jgi:hypothetical protein
MIFSTAIRTPPPDLSGYARVFHTTMDLSIGSNTVTHNLDLFDSDSFTISVFVGSSAVQVDVDTIDVNSLTLTTLVAATNAHITIVGI